MPCRDLKILINSQSIEAFPQLLKAIFNNSVKKTSS